MRRQTVTIALWLGAVVASGDRCRAASRLALEGGGLGMPWLTKVCRPSLIGAGSASAGWGDRCGSACTERATWNGDHGESGVTRGQLRGVERVWKAERPPCVSAGGRRSKPGERLGGQGRGRTADLPIFSRTLVPTELPGRTRDENGRMNRPLLLGATPTGLEPATSAVTGRRANQLRYGALLKALPNVSPTGFEPVLPP